MAEEALQRIAELYAIEEEARQGLRQQEALPRLRALHDRLFEQRVTTADGTGLARAIDYSLKRWPAILRYVEGGELPVDNNQVENAIRPVCLGRSNRLFTESEREGRRTTAKLNDLEF